MPSTPEVLQEKFQIPSSAGATRAVPRVLLAFKGAKKKDYLSVVVPMIMAGALPEHGQNRKYHRPVTQKELAAQSSVTRSTFTRRLTRFATPDVSWTEDRRAEFSKTQRESAAKRGRKVHDRPVRSQRLVGELVTRRRGFAQPNKYNLRIPQAMNPDRPECFYPPSIEDLREDATTSPFFRELSAGFKKWQGFGKVQAWVWDARLPVSDIARLVMTYYQMVGLGSVDERTKQVCGVVHPKQETVAAACGISVRSVYKANRQWAALGIIRVAHPKPVIKNGQYVRGPARIVYLPVRQLTQDEAAVERTRFAAQLARAARHNADFNAHLARSLHQELIDTWQGKEHSLGAFYNELRRRMGRGGIGQQTIDLLVPKPPDDPPTTVVN